jgi:hypothetical protein
VYTLIDDRLWFVDTGASHTTCDDDFVAALHLPTTPTPYASAGETGTVALDRAVLPDATIGGWTWKKLPCAVRDLGTTSSIPELPDDPVAGVLGDDLLRHFVLDFDFVTGTLWLRPAAAGSTKGARLHREAGIGRRLVAPLVVDGTSAPAIVDTGADQTYLSLQTGPVVQRYEGVRKGSGPTGSVPVEVVIRGVEQAALDDRAIDLDSYIYRVGDVGLLGMDALGRPHLEVDGPHRRLRWTDGDRPALPTPDEGRRALLAADESEAGLARLARFELDRGHPADAVAIYRRLLDPAAESWALLAAGRWDDAVRLIAAVDPGGKSPAARVVRVVESVGDPAESLPESAVVRRAWTETRTVRDQLWAIEHGATADQVGRGEHAALLRALALERGAPGVSAAPCALLPDPADADQLLLALACGQRDRAFAALDRLRSAAPEDPGLLDVAARLATPEMARTLLDRAVRLAPLEAYFQLRRRELG